MSAGLAIISEVESALNGASSEKRTDILRRVTDLFVASSDNCSEAQAEVFDGVMGQLISHVESRATIELSHRLSNVSNAPRETVRRCISSRLTRSMPARRRRTITASRNCGVTSSRRLG